MSSHEEHVRDVVIQRAYEDPTPHDGYRVLVDRFWPRGRSKGTLQLDDWAKDIAPDAALVKWFGHESSRWNEFRSRYAEALEAPVHVQKLEEMVAAAGERRITLVYGAHDQTRNQAVVLRDVLMALRASKP